MFRDRSPGILAPEANVLEGIRDGSKVAIPWLAASTGGCINLAPLLKVIDNLNEEI